MTKPVQNVPVRIVLHQRSQILELEFPQGEVFQLPSEYLRVYSPSAEVRGHGPGQEVLQTGKREVAILAIEPVGHYAIQLQFSDGHTSGIYSWDWLHKLGCEQPSLWADYLARLEAAGESREAAGEIRETGAPARVEPEFGTALKRKPTP
jgi:DUF971 family protein